MSVLAVFKKHQQPKVPNSQYIRTENEPAKMATKPVVQPINPDQPEVD